MTASTSGVPLLDAACGTSSVIKVAPLAAVTTSGVVNRTGIVVVVVVVGAGTVVVVALPG